MRPFNYEEARAGKPICTRDGREARIVDWDYEENYPLVVIITEKDGTKHINSYTEKGAFVYSAETDKDLMMKSERHELWKVIIKNEDTGEVFGNRGRDFESKEEAEKWAEMYSEKDSLSVLDIVKLYEWED